MTGYFERTYNLSDPKLVSTYDDLFLWAAPSGLKVLDTINTHPNLTVLDIGPGPGFPLIEITNRLGLTSRIFGIDPWEGGMGWT